MGNSSRIRTAVVRQLIELASDIQNADVEVPPNPFVNPEADMGFPAGWSSEDLWASAPDTERSLPTPTA